METKDSRHSVIMAGIGGKGVLMAGQILAKAALPQYKYVSWTPTYYTLMRGGASECTVIMSNEHPGAPVLPLARKVVVFEPSQLKPFQGRVRPGGILITESAGLPEIDRDDVRVLKVPAVDVASKLGDVMAANFVLLGAYIGVSKAVRPELVEAELEKRFGHKGKVLDINRGAFREGLKLADEAGF
ncbi:MAG: 2-oxoacid:acceptor oxidoreductase family protein [Chloroflexota bacterium]